MLKLIGIASNVKVFILHSMEKWRTELTGSREFFGWRAKTRDISRW